MLFEPSMVTENNQIKQNNELKNETSRRKFLTDTDRRARARTNGLGSSSAVHVMQPQKTQTHDRSAKLKENKKLLKLLSVPPPTSSWTGTWNIKVSHEVLSIILLKMFSYVRMEMSDWHGHMTLFLTDFWMFDYLLLLLVENKSPHDCGWQPSLLACPVVTMQWEITSPSGSDFDWKVWSISQESYVCCSLLESWL